MDILKVFGVLMGYSGREEMGTFVVVKGVFGVDGVEVRHGGWRRF